MFIGHLLCASCWLRHGYVVIHRLPVLREPLGQLTVLGRACGPGLGSVWIGGLTQQS